MPRVALSQEEVAVVRAGSFVRVNLGTRYLFRDGARAETAFVGMADGVLVAYANVCMHHPTPLDVSDFEKAPHDPHTHLPLAPLTDDGERLLCLTHGAEFEKKDGLCIMGPCFGQRLAEIQVEEGAFPEISLVL